MPDFTDEKCEGICVRIVLFPGQGSLRPGMGLPWRSHSARTLLSDISDISGVDVARLVDEADKEELVRTDNAQLATFALSAMAGAACGGLNADLAIGHSLGEYSALAFAGILDLASATRLVLERGRAMAEASSLTPGTMVAVLGAEPDVLLRAIASFPGLVVANRNAPGQCVVAGPLESINAFREQSKELGIRKVMALDVGGAFHSPLMAPAQPALITILSATQFHDGSIPVVANIDATPHQDGSPWPMLLAEQLTGPVLFQESVETITESDLEFIELGPGGVLCGLVKRMKPDATLLSIGTPEDVVSNKKELS